MNKTDATQQLLRIYDDFIAAVRLECATMVHRDRLPQKIEKLCDLAENRRGIFIDLLTTLEDKKNEDPLIIQFHAARNETSTDTLYGIDSKGMPYYYDYNSSKWKKV